MSLNNNDSDINNNERMSERDKRPIIVHLYYLGYMCVCMYVYCQLDTYSISAVYQF